MSCLEIISINKLAIFCTSPYLETVFLVVLISPFARDPDTKCLKAREKMNK